MPAPRKDEKAAAMYALYQQGHSLAQVALAFGATRQGVFKMFDLRAWPMREKPELPFVMWTGRKYTLRANGYYARTSDGRRYLHREVWEAHRGPIPAKHDVHHKDENKANNDIGNLELLSCSEHGKLHAGSNTGFISTQFKKGRAGTHYPRRLRL